VGHDAPASTKIELDPARAAELRKRSDARVNSDRDVAYLKDEIERFKERGGEKRVADEAQR